MRRARARSSPQILARSIRMTSEELGSGLIHGSADREDVDPTSTSIAFEPCRVDDVLPAEFIAATYDLCAAHIKLISSPDFEGSYTPYIIRNLNAFVSLGRFEDAFRLLSVALGVPKAKRLEALGRGRLGRAAGAGLHRRHAPHLDWSGVRHRD